MAHPSGIECIEITRWFSFSAGNAIKYLWRAGLKGSAVQDLNKALWYIDDARVRGPAIVPAWADSKFIVACAGFPNPLTGQAIKHIAKEEWPQAVCCVEEMISQAERRAVAKAMEYADE
jgi:hypothetical protein